MCFFGNNKNGNSWKVSCPNDKMMTFVWHPSGLPTHVKKSLVNHSKHRMKVKYFSKNLMSNHILYVLFYTPDYFVSKGHFCKPPGHSPKSGLPYGTCPGTRNPGWGEWSQATETWRSSSKTGWCWNCQWRPGMLRCRRVRDQRGICLNIWMRRSWKA